MLKTLIATALAALLMTGPGSIPAEAKDPWKYYRKAEEKQAKAYYKYQRKQAKEWEKYERKKAKHWARSGRSYYPYGW